VTAKDFESQKIRASLKVTADLPLDC